MIYGLSIIIFIVLLGLIICLLITASIINKLEKRVNILESDLDKLEDICTSFITQDDLDDFCESLYDNIQNVSEKFQDTLEDEINSK